MPPIRIAVSANFTAEPIREPLQHLLNLLALPQEVAHIEFAPFDQVFQTLLDPQSVFATNSRGVNILLLDTTNWTEQDTLELATALEQTHFQVPLIAASGPGTRRLLDSPNLIWIEGDAIVETNPTLQVLDPHADREARIPYTAPYFAALALRLARAIRTTLTSLPATKVIAVDCDSTLWHGVCGEDGPEGVTLDPGRRRLQEFLVEQRALGKLICLASKNNEEDVWDTFRAHPEFPLRPEHCVAWRINWDPKSQNLASLAEELSLGADSFVFIDDDRRECGEVRSDLPETVVLELPANPDEIPAWLDNLWIFDHHGKSTEEDLKRNQYYSETSARSRLERQTANFEEFIARLELEIRIEPLGAAAVPRAAQLTQRTNQMNFSTVRRNEPELAQLIESHTLEGRVVYVKDRFGDYGLVGLLLLQAASEANAPLQQANSRPAIVGQALACAELQLRLTPSHCSAGGVEAPRLLQPAPPWSDSSGEPPLVIDTMLLSCRAMGRGVEHAMLREAAAIAGQRDVVIHYSPTRKNAPARAILETLDGAEPVEAGYRIPAAKLAQFAFKPVKPMIETEDKKPIATAIQHPDYAAIAALKDDPDRLLALLSQPSATVTLSGSNTEQRVAAIWARMLPVTKLSLDDDFFDLGGHSLLAVQLLTRIRETFAVELSLDLIYSDKLTIRRLAAIVDNGGQVPDNDPGQLSEAEYAALLAEVENLSDEEVQALLGDAQ